jgi:hypothetical protein
LYIFYLANLFVNNSQIGDNISSFLAGNENQFHQCINPKYFSKKNIAPCYKSNNFLISILINNPANNNNIGSYFTFRVEICGFNLFLKIEIKFLMERNISILCNGYYDSKKN